MNIRSHAKGLQLLNARLAQALLIILGQLQRTMDPLVAAQVYDYGLCPFLSRLPEELFLCTFDFLLDDPPAL